ncbi:pyridoxal phosphate-dependent aminotransferase [Butyrivibrio sp. MC2013]|uniref:pyridoxal phosphate-dependent aminotransferase n=1 Tax=Butyrivibrio sp. MC2013 TaxID=1280686 RepID=UPI00040E089D|nr:histidinol-phosphate transaminase [Butyrivibrio sp. MC2013]
MWEYIHGGSSYRAEKIELDMSVNLNAFGLPSSVKEAVISNMDKAVEYPDPDCLELTNEIVDWEKRHSGYELIDQQIICGNGASELINAAVTASGASSALVQTPIFYGYERAVRNSGIKLIRGDSLAAMPGVRLRTDKDGRYFMPTMEMAEQVRTTRAGLVILCNPSNPTGSCIREDVLEEIVKAAKEAGSRIIIDECFLPICEDYKERTALKFLKDYPDIMIIRSLTKLYSMPGIRSGYAISGSRYWEEDIRRALPEWNMGSLVQLASIAALRDDRYLEESLAYIRQEKDRLMQALLFMGLDLIPGRANYLMIRSRDTDLKAALLEKGILIRALDNYAGLFPKGFYRICVRKKEDNDRLIAAVRECIP